MFKNLENIDWDKRGASNVPILLRNMTSKDESIRHNAFTMFEESVLYIDDYSPEGINFQDGLFDFLKADVQLLVIPFLLEMLGNEALYDRDRVVGLLCFMTRYREFADEDKANHIMDAMWNGKDLYISLLHDKESRMRMEVVRLLCAYSEYADFTAPHLSELLATETDENRIIILWEIDTNLLVQDIPAAAKASLSDVLEKFTNTDCTYALRITAAVTLIDMLGDMTPQPVVDFLVDTMINKNEVASTYHSLALIPNKQARTIVKLGVLRGLPTAIKIVDETYYLENGFNALVSAIILAFYPDEKLEGYAISVQKRLSESITSFIVTLPYTFRPSINTRLLDASQEAVIEAIVGHDWIWQTDTNIFEVFGLPQSRDELHALL